MSDARDFLDTWPARMGQAKTHAPDAAKGFGALFQAVMKDGALRGVDKELIALAIGMALRCDACVYAHAQKAVRLGATRAQVMEAAGVVVMMQGGPGYTYLPKIVEALDAIEAIEASTATAA